jgi:L-threonylcarbamoyladenylate synthase
VLSKAQLAESIALLQAGGVIAFPTETVYALAGDARNLSTIKRIFTLKNRPLQQPLSVLLPLDYDFSTWVSEVSPVARQLAANFWPGPLTLIMNKHESVLAELTGGQAKIGLRVPDHPVAQALLHAFAGGLAAPSANRSCYLSPTQASHVHVEFGDQLDSIIDGGACIIGIESTIVDVTTTPPRLVRVGAISPKSIQKVINCDLFNISPHSNQNRKFALQQIPGQKLEAVILGYLNQGKSVSVLARRASVLNHERLHWIAMPKQATKYAQVLYQHLHEIAQNLTDEILIEALPFHEEAWAGIRSVIEK